MVEVVGTAPTSAMVITKFVYRRSWKTNLFNISFINNCSINLIMRKTKFCIALGFSGGIIKKINKSWEILSKKFKMKYVSNNNCVPHITLVSGVLNLDNQNLAYKILKNIKYKKFKLKSPGLAIFANKKPNLYVRWERDKEIIKIRELITKKTSKYFSKKSKYCEDKLWEPRSVIAWNDLRYENVKNIVDKINFLFKEHQAIVDCLLFIDFTKKEKIINQIRFK